MAADFYDEWLELTEKARLEQAAARKVIRPQDLDWVTTRQDARAALLISPQNGFRTWGTTTMVAEIPVGWKTGEHSHGEEGVFIHYGRGCSVVNGERFDWTAGDCLWIPFGARHQHFNLGDSPVRYMSALCPQLEYTCLVLDFQQYAERGPFDAVPGADSADGDHDRDGRQIVFRQSDAPFTPPRAWPADATTDTAFRSSIPPVTSADTVAGPQRGSIHMMYAPKSVGEEIELTHIFTFGPGDSSPKHAHMEAMLYVIRGRGYAIVDDERFEWEEGGAFHVSGPQTTHQYWATEEASLLRVHFGIRSKFFQPIARGRFPYLTFGAQHDAVPS